MTDPDGVISYPGRTSEMAEKPSDAACGCLVPSQTRNSVRRSSGAPVKHWDVDSFFRVTKAALRHIPDGGTISNTGSINGLRGNTSYSRDHGC